MSTVKEPRASWAARGSATLLQMGGQFGPAQPVHISGYLPTKPWQVMAEKPKFSPTLVPAS